jgi:protein-disulfide isomerase
MTEISSSSEESKASCCATPQEGGGACCDKKKSCCGVKKIFCMLAILGVGGFLGYFLRGNAAMIGQAEPTATAGISAASVEEIAKKVITDNPELIMESLNNLQKKSYENKMKQASEGLKTSQKELYADAHSPVAGAKDAVVTVVEFFDYHCGYCKKISPVMKQVLDENKDVNVIFKEYPILSPDSREASRASLAIYALAPEKYFEFHQLLMDYRGEYSAEKLAEFAGKVGVSADALKSEMAKEWVEKELQDVAALADKLGVQGTPAIVIGEELIPGAMEYKAMEFRIKAARDLASKK